MCLFVFDIEAHCRFFLSTIEVYLSTTTDKNPVRLLRDGPASLKMAAKAHMEDIHVRRCHTEYRCSPPFAPLPPEHVLRSAGDPQEHGYRLHTRHAPLGKVVGAGCGLKAHDLKTPHG